VPNPRATRPDAAVPVAIVEDQPDLRAGLAALIGGFPGFTCAGAYGTMEDALRGMARAVPDIALVDLGLPGMSGIDGIREIRRYPAVLALVLTVHSDDGRVRGAARGRDRLHVEEHAARAAAPIASGNRRRRVADVA
jgi:DNA-binding NarL/FixJ family response regulator